MGGILLGWAAFSLLMLFDWAAWRGLRWLKWLALLVSLGAFIGALVWVARDDASLPISPPVQVLGGIVALIFFLLLLYSLIIEIPLAATYLSAGAPNQVVNTGTYALTRHPGVLWFGPFAIGLALAIRSATLLLATPLWWLADVAYVCWQDAYLFPRQFPTYRQYQQKTPMLWPTRASLRRCLNSLPWRKGRLT